MSLVNDSASLPEIVPRLSLSMASYPGRRRFPEGPARVTVITPSRPGQQRHHSRQNSSREPRPPDLRDVIEKESIVP
jgi:hypothetical protein